MLSRGVPQFQLCSLFGFLFITVVFFAWSCEASVSVSKTKTKACPGLYCGKLSGSDTCGPCPRGYRPNNFSECTKCDDRVTFYDSLYLAFMALLSLVLHWFFIDYLCQTRSSSKRSVLVLHASAFVESAVSALMTLVLSDPVGSLYIRSCHVQQLSDWYSMLFNPTPNYTDTLYCTQEVVYPLYTIVMIYYSFSLVLMMLIRPFITYTYGDSRSKRSIYAALYFLPALIITQAVFGGLIYYSFPYIILVVSVMTNAIHFSARHEPTMIQLVKICFTQPRHAIILFGHWVFHAFGIIALTGMESPTFHASLLALIPFPTIFYILTVSFTDTDNLEVV